MNSIAFSIPGLLFCKLGGVTRSCLRLGAVVAILAGILAVAPIQADPVKPVTIENLPLPVFDIDSTALQPHQASAQVIINNLDPDPGTSNITVVPADKLLVIETVTGRCFKGSSGSSHRMSVETTGGGTTAEFDIPRAGVGVYGRYAPNQDFEGTVSTTSMYFGGSLKLYADPSTPVVVTFDRNITTGDSSCRAAIAGHFVDM